MKLCDVLTELITPLYLLLVPYVALLIFFLFTSILAIYKRMACSNLGRRFFLKKC